MNPSPSRKPTLWVVIVPCLLISLFCLIYPIYVIRPFRAQGPRELMAALFVIRFRPFATGFCAGLASTAAVLYWRLRRRIWKKAAAGVAALAVCGTSALSRVNVYELMFHPLGRPDFESALQSRLDKDEKVVAIEVNGVARAYPIRGMSYHHIVNDTVGNVAVVATY